MRGIGALLAVYGFLSAVLYFFDYSIMILSWADRWQPAFGLIVGCAGMVFLGISLWTHKEEPTEPQQGGPYATPGAPPMIGNTGPQPAPMSGPGPHRIPQQGPQFGQRPPQGPPPQGRPGQPPQYPQQYPPQYPPPPGGPTGFGPQGGPPYGPRG